MTNQLDRIRSRDQRALARAATGIENGAPEAMSLLTELGTGAGSIVGNIVGITGPPGAGKSTLVDALAGEMRRRGKTVGILAIDPTSRKTGGAILGDRIRMQQHHNDAGVFIRSLATRGAAGGLARATGNVARLLQGAGFDYVLIETVGVGQDEVDIASLADLTVLVLTPGMGDDVQAIKAGIMEVADVYVINKADHAGVERTECEIRAEARAAPIVRTVATEGTGVAELLNVIDRAPKKSPPAEDHAAAAVKSINDALRSFERALKMKPGSLEIDHLAVRVAGVPSTMNPERTGGIQIKIVES